MSNMEIDRVLAQIRAISSQTKIGQTPGVSHSQGIQGTAPSDFAKLLSEGLGSVSQAANRADSLSTAFELGTPGVELSQVMLEVQKANLTFRAMTEVRNKLINAYQEVMNMPI